MNASTHSSIPFLLLVSLLAVLTAACGGGSGAGQAPPGTTPTEDVKPTWEPVFDVAAFDAPGSNPHFPLVPGTTFTYEADTDDGLEVNEVQVTHETREILGITCIVVLDRVWVEGDLRELTYDWYAVDEADNVWYLGEETYEYEGGVVVGTEGSWEAGVLGALPGVLVPGSPYPGQSYFQEYAEDVAEDMGKVLRLDASASVPYGEFEDCLVTKEWTPLAPGAIEQKRYAPGVGLVLVDELSGGPTVRVELVAVETD
jgi:hypothetical protein